MGKTLRVSAWVPDQGAVHGEPTDPAGWALRQRKAFPPQLLAPVVADPRNWRSKDVGWGVVLADGAAIPPALQQLLDARGKAMGLPGAAPVFRYMPKSEIEYVCLRNYDARKDVAIEGSPCGTAPDALPTYLLIYGGPEQVPWRLQYVLNNTRCVGRIDLAGDALRNYVDAMRLWDNGGDFGTESARAGHVVVWAVDKSEEDITHLMRDAIAAPLAERYSGDNQLTVDFIDGDTGAGATGPSLQTSLKKRPGLIVTTSHGRTGPLADRNVMAGTLGFLVAQDGKTLGPDTLLSQWQPAGAVWYAHACCSAGSDGVSNFSGIFAPGTQAAAVLDGVASLGSSIAALPRALLGAKRPLRAFIGHVEPTFDWTLELPQTGQHLTAGLIDALYTRLFVGAGAQPAPVGYALRGWFARAAGLEAQRRAIEVAFNRGADVDELLLATQLSTRDLESMVILGDPTVAIPALT